MSLTKDMHPALKQFIDNVDDSVQKQEYEEIITKKVAKYMKKLLQEEDIFPDVFKKPNPDKYTLYPVYIAPDKSFSIASAVWDVGQSTPIHDHGTWGVIGIIQGEEHEIQYEISQETVPVKITEHNLCKGEVTICCTSDQDVHKVSSATDEPCVGIHVYGGDIGEIERHVYDPQNGEKSTVVTGWGSIQ